MTLSFSWEWDRAPEVRVSEHAATWARLSIKVGDVVATLVEERDRSHGVRKSLDLPTYPLAEWLALHWWQLNAPAHVPSDHGVRFTEAGGGFPWPDITLLSDRDLVMAKVEPRDRHPEFVRFLTRGSDVLSGEQVRSEVGMFIDRTVRRLEECGVTGTLLQGEWEAIQAADDEESEFCVVAASWGLDPYDPDPVAAEALMTAGIELGDLTLLTDLARAVNLEDLPRAEAWLSQARQMLPPGSTAAVPVSFGAAHGHAPGEPSRPWLEGYRQARYMRQILDLGLDPVPLENFVQVESSRQAPPVNVDALVTASGTNAGVVVGPHVGRTARRFSGARALGRQAMGIQGGLSLLTRGAGGSRHSDQVERAFAAEFLAPAEGIRRQLDGDFSEEALQSVAEAFEVSPALVERQVENQLVA